MTRHSAIGRLGYAAVLGAALALGGPSPRVARRSGDDVPKVLGVDFQTSEQPSRPPPKAKPESYFAGNGPRECARRLRQVTRARAR